MDLHCIPIYITNSDFGQYGSSLSSFSATGLHPPKQNACIFVLYDNSQTLTLTVCFGLFCLLCWCMQGARGEVPHGIAGDRGGGGGEWDKAEPDKPPARSVRVKYHRSQSKLSVCPVP